MHSSTYDALMRALDQGGEPHAADRRLLAALRRLAVEAAHDNASEAAASAYLSVQDAIDTLRNQKIHEQRRRQRQARERAARQTRLKPTREHAARLVRMKAHQLGMGQFRASEQKAIGRTLAEMPVDEAARRMRITKGLTPIEQRAVEIVCGAPPKNKKNRIETEAIRLAEAVKTEWFAERARQPPGRPKGSMIGTASDNVERLPSVSEVVAAIGPIIKRLADAAATSAMIAAVVAAVDCAGLHCPANYAAALIRRRTTNSL